MAKVVEVVAYTDGGARGNPGPAGIGVHLTSKTGRTVAEIAEAIGWATNNVAEYTAVIRALERAQELGARRVLIRADSLLVVEQLRGTYKVKHADMKRLHARAAALASSFESIQFEHVPRGQNKKADALVNQAIDDWLADNPGGAEPPAKAGDPTLFGG